VSNSAPEAMAPGGGGPFRARLALRLGFLLAATLLTTMSAVRLNAQDVEVAAAVLEQPLPQGYYARIAADADAFELRGGWIAKAEAARAAGMPVAGDFPLLVVPASFADSNAPTVSRDQLQRVLFDGPTDAGTLSEFYEVSSQGLFTVRGEVAPWVQTSLTVEEVRGTSFGLGDDARTGDWLREALALSDASVDFTRFDNDGPDGIPDSGDDDGVVDALAVEFLEAATTCAGTGPTIWGHRWEIAGWGDGPYVSDDMGANGEMIQANDYVVQAAERCDGRTQTTVVIAHEFGHAIGLPDLYDQTEGIFPSLRNWVVGCWSIMAAGQWGCGPALAEGRWDRPTHFGPWEKSELGWLPDLVVAGEVLEEVFTLRPVETTGDVLRLDLSPTEYLLVEYRDGSGFDANLPGTGILVHHIDETRITGARRCRGCPRVYVASLLEADDDDSLLTPEGEGGSRGEAGDIFAEAGIHRITNTTSPSSRLSSGAPSDVAIRRMVVENGVATITVSTRTVAPDALFGPFFGDAGQAPTSEEQLFLDAFGNRDGAYDLGDLATYFRAHPSVRARALPGPRTPIGGER
jgi:M6 family metalloprotease-like protein